MTISTSPAGAFIPEWTLTDRMRKARESRGLSQVQIAAETGISRRTISSIETGEKTPGRKEFLLYALVTGVPITWLETGNAPEPDDGPEGGSSVHPLGLEPRTH